MERTHRLLLVAGLLAALLPSAAATFGPQPGAPCDPALLATQAALFCAPDMPTAQCCEPVVAAVDLGGGVPCLCRVAAEPQLVMAGLNASHLLKLYTSCGGLQDGARLAAACEGPAPPAAVVSSPPPPPPPSPAPRRKQAAHDAPPPQPSSEKPSSPPPQEHAGNAKAAPNQAATSPLAPAAATAPPPQGPHSAAPSSETAFIFAATAILAIYIIL
ncbi:hypothetical protein ZWY2020_054068 [Hordeum vulgare]|nr:hypothetical protein ZWY2020_054068 [Hordeum vulgare]